MNQSSTINKKREPQQSRIAATTIDRVVEHGRFASTVFTGRKCQLLDYFGLVFKVECRSLVLDNATLE
jgi:hypothetical protein